MKKPTKAQIRKRGRILMAVVGIASLLWALFFPYVSGIHLPLWISVTTFLISCPSSILLTWLGVKLAELLFAEPSTAAQESPPAAKSDQ
jgi:hypothetical protein